MALPRCHFASTDNLCRDYKSWGKSHDHGHERCALIPSVHRCECIAELKRGYGQALSSEQTSLALPENGKKMRLLVVSTAAVQCLKGPYSYHESAVLYLVHNEYPFLHRNADSTRILWDSWAVALPNKGALALWYFTVSGNSVASINHVLLDHDKTYALRLLVSPYKWNTTTGTGKKNRCRCVYA
jgi:hypothetical protein